MLFFVAPLGLLLRIVLTMKAAYLHLFDSLNSFYFFKYSSNSCQRVVASRRPIL